ncbi:hypothetical protein K438DRAFT_1761484 [Mycena galopus ATCC 62051]|nr:hypothetical protein K438DRAFT_1761484 [Mycena galopus ATCC 62051]
MRLLILFAVLLQAVATVTASATRRSEAVGDDNGQQETTRVRKTKKPEGNQNGACDGKNELMGLQSWYTKTRQKRERVFPSDGETNSGGILCCAMQDEGFENGVGGWKEILSRGPRESDIGKECQSVGSSAKRELTTERKAGMVSVATECSTALFTVTGRSGGESAFTKGKLRGAWTYVAEEHAERASNRCGKEPVAESHSPRDMQPMRGARREISLA